MPVALWSTTASNNATADSASGINWAEGQAPSSVNDSARAMMAVIARDFASGATYSRLPNNKLIARGTSALASSDYTITFPTAFSGAPVVVVVADASPGASSVYNVTVDGRTATGFNVRTRTISSGSVTATNSIPINWFAYGDAP